MKINIDLRSEIDEFLTDYGFYILLHRTGRKIRCRCWDEKYQEANSKCLLCGGEGWVGNIERHQVRKDSAIQIVSQPNLNMQTDIGKMWVNAYNFYLRHDAHPKVGDLIYEVGWNKHKPTHLIQAYRINDVATLRGDNGRIEFWMGSCKGETMNADFKNVVVRSVGPIKNYEIIS